MALTTEQQHEPQPAEAVRMPDYAGLAEDVFEEGTDLGAVRIHNNVISVIARQAALDVPGVVEMSGNLVDGLAGVIGKKPGERGIRIDVAEQTVTIDLQVVLAFGVRIPEVCWQLQNKVREAVERMTGKNVQAVNVVVQGIRLPGEASG